MVFVDVIASKIVDVYNSLVYGLIRVVMKIMCNLCVGVGVREEYLVHRHDNYLLISTQIWFTATLLSVSGSSYDFA